MPATKTKAIYSVTWKSHVGEKDRVYRQRFAASYQADLAIELFLELNDDYHVYDVTLTKEVEE